VTRIQERFCFSKTQEGFAHFDQAAPIWAVSAGIEEPGDSACLMELDFREMCHYSYTSHFLNR